MEVHGQLHASAVLSRGKSPTVLIGYECVWTPELVWTLWGRENLMPPPGIESQRSSRLNTPGFYNCLKIVRYKSILHVNIVTISLEWTVPVS